MNQPFEQSFAEGNFTLYFVLRDDQEMEDTPLHFQEAFESCFEKTVMPEQISESLCKGIKLHGKFVIVVQEFSGDLFDYLCQSKAIIIGPQCVLECLSKGEPIPLIASPVFNFVMKNVVISVTGFTRAEKAELKVKINYMGGIYCQDFTATVTHLIAKHSKTEKYGLAAQRRIPVMTDEWVSKCWEQSQIKSICATESPYSDFIFQAFYNLSICVTQLPKAEKNKLKQMVESKGGKYCPAFDASVDVLVVGASYGEKYNCAKKWEIPCVKVAWIEDSFKLGYALKYSDYEVEPVQRSSTPTGDHSVLDPHMSILSSVTQLGDNVRIDETFANATFMEPSVMKKPRLMVVRNRKKERIGGPARILPLKM